ncbi:TonB-dependent receptor domain-containing protein, partial [Bacteroidota bacterium]
EKPLVEYKMDKKIVNVSRDIISQGGSATDALQNVPSINVDLDGNVTMRGSSNFTVFINGRPSVLEGSDALDQIPAASIDNIEIITNPSAKYDPDGIGGIINVVLKKNSQEGLTGLFDLSVGTKDKYSTNLLLNYGVSDFNFFGGIDFRDNNRSADGVSRNIYKNRIPVVSDTAEMTGGRRHNGYTAKGGISWEITDMSSIKIEGNYGEFGFSRRHNSDRFQWIDGMPDLDSNFSNQNTMTRNSNYYKINLDYRLKFDNRGQNLTALAYFSSRDGGGDNLQDDYITDENWNPVLRSTYNNYSTEDEVSEGYRFQLDYVLPFSEDSKFEAGAQSRLDREVEKYVYQDWDHDLNDWDEYARNSMDYLRDIHSVYSTYAGKYMDFSFMAGLRGEYTLRSIKDVNINKEYKIDRVDWFPTLHMSQDLGNDHQIMASYSRRIHRPRGWDLEPSRVRYDAHNYREGNPALEPEYIDSYEIGYQKYFGMSYVSVESYYRRTNNLMDRISDTSGADYIWKSMNLGSDHSLGVEMIVNYEPYKWLRLNLSGTYYHYSIDSSLAGSARNSNVWDSRINATFMITPTTRFQIIGDYEGPKVEAQGTEGYDLEMSMALRQEFWDRAAALTLQVRNVLGTDRRERTTDIPTKYSYYLREREFPIVQLSFSYKLNNFMQKKEERDMDSNGMDDGF